MNGGITIGAINALEGLRGQTIVCAMFTGTTLILVLDNGKQLTVSPGAYLTLRLELARAPDVGDVVSP